MQKGAFSGALVRVGRIRAQQDGGRVDTAPGEDVMARTNLDLATCWRNAARVHGEALQCGDAPLVRHKTVGAGQVEQLAAGIQCGRDSRHQHRLLGIGRAAAIAQIQTASHVARDHRPAVAECGAAVADPCRLRFSAHEEFVDQLLQRLAVRGIDHSRGIETLLDKDALGLAEGVQPIVPVVMTHSRRANAPERQIIPGDMQQRVVEADPAGMGVAQHMALLGSVIPEVVQHQRAGRALT